MKAWLCLLAFAAVVLVQADVFGLTPPSKSDGPVRLLNCVVSPNGVLEAEVDNKSEDPVECTLRCNYEIGGHTFSQWFTETIPARYNGRIGKFDTSGAKPGNYSGDVGSCKKTVGRGGAL